MLIKQNIKSYWPWLMLLLAGCASVGITQFDPLDSIYGQASVKNRMGTPHSPMGENYLSEVKPILEQRCVVCHGCYDAPCQLKLSSPMAIDRGASKDIIYEGSRILASEPTRLGIDAKSTFEWRKKGFHPVLNERSQTPQVNLQASLLYRFLEQKQQHPDPKQTILGNEYKIGTDREELCPTLNEYGEYKQQYPSHGMPFGLPALSLNEHQTLTNWVAQGSPMSNKPPIPTKYLNTVKQWETFLNKDNFKHQLMARYVYEHIYLAHLYFTDIESNPDGQAAPKEYFTLVRSATPPGFAIDPISTRRPYDDPGVSKVYYRLQREQGTILAKTHMPYELNNKRMQWMKKLFINADYDVSQLPSYAPEVAANPFVAFKDIPAQSRYRFMLEEAQFTIMGFIKGPVCRGQIALNVIDDHFWAVFVNPELSPKKLEDFINEQSANLILPGEKQSNADLLSNWLSLSIHHNKYLGAKKDVVKRLNKLNKLDMDLIWDGDGHNPNAALTIFRHFDSATVLKGLVGQEPKTAWIIDYPLLERIHYLLVAEYDVFGNVGHHINTRLYMDFLRMEAEANFLALLPPKVRKSLWQYWYRNSQQEVKEFVFGAKVNFKQPSNIQYKTDQPKLELLGLIKDKLSSLSESRFNLSNSKLDSAIKALQEAPAMAATIMPEIGILSLQTKHDLNTYTIIRNSGHSNIDSLLFEDGNRLPKEDYLTVTRGITGSYPAAYWHMEQSKLSDFINAVVSLKSEQDYKELMDRFAIRRTHEQFWQHSDKILKQFKKDEPIEAGLLDYNRLENR